MANLSGLTSFVSELRVERTNLIDRLRHVRCGSFSSRQVEQRSFGAHGVSVGSQADEPSAEGAMGKESLEKPIGSDQS